MNWLINALTEDAGLPPAFKELYVAFGTTLDKFHDEPEFRLPMPARYIVDKHGLIRAADVNFEMEPADPPARLAPDRDHHGSRAKPRTPRRHRIESHAVVGRTAEGHGR